MLAQTTGTPSALSETYGDWVVRCNTTTVSEQPKLICEMAQELTQRDSGQRILAISLQPNETGAQITFIAPFGLLLAKGLHVDIGEALLLDTGFKTCLPAGCIAITDMSVGAIAALTAGDEATAVMVGYGNGQEIRITIPLTGFAAAWNRLKDMQK